MIRTVVELLFRDSELTVTEQKISFYIPRCVRYRFQLHKPELDLRWHHRMFDIFSSVEYEVAAIVSRHWVSSRLWRLH